MRKIIRFIEEYALAEDGQIAGPELDKRVTALREMLHYDDMNGDQFQEAMTVAHFPLYFAAALSRAFSRFDFAVKPCSPSQPMKITATSNVARAPHLTPWGRSARRPRPLEQAGPAAAVRTL